MIEDKIDFEIVEAGKDGLTFKATITTKPEVNITDYKGLKITPKSTEVTEEDVDDKIKELLDRHSRHMSKSVRQTGGERRYRCDGFRGLCRRRSI